MRVAKTIELDAHTERELRVLAKRRRVEARLQQRAIVVLLAAKGLQNKDIAVEVGRVNGSGVIRAVGWLTGVQRATRQRDGSVSPNHPELDGRQLSDAACEPQQTGAREDLPHLRLCITIQATRPTTTTSRTGTQ